MIYLFENVQNNPKKNIIYSQKSSESTKSRLCGNSQKLTVSIRLASNDGQCTDDKTQLKKRKRTESGTQVLTKEEDIRPLILLRTTDLKM